MKYVTFEQAKLVNDSKQKLEAVRDSFESRLKTLMFTQVDEIKNCKVQLELTQQALASMSMIP